MSASSLSLLGELSRVGWADHALCKDVKDPDIFFPSSSESPVPALKICAKCPVRIPCLTYAILNDQKYGVWGGMSQFARKRMVKRGPDGSVAVGRP